MEFTHRPGQMPDTTAAASLLFYIGGFLAVTFCVAQIPQLNPACSEFA